MTNAELSNASRQKLTLPLLRREWIQYWNTDRGRLLHAFKTALALVLSMWLCMRLELQQPRTAMVSVVIIMMHQQVGGVIARGFYRVVGMLIGGVAGLGLMVAFPQQPVLFFLALAGWAGVCVWGAAYYRNYQSYGFVLAGYAIAITAVPAWSNPQTVFDSVTTTFFEVMVGAVAAGLVSALILPQHVGAMLLGAGQRHASSFLHYVHRMLRNDLFGRDVDQMHVQLVVERAQIENLRSAAVFEDPAMRLSNPLMAKLNHDFLGASAGFHVMRQVRARALRGQDKAALGVIEPLFAEFDAILPPTEAGKVLTVQEFAALLERLEAFMPGLPARIAHYREQLIHDDVRTRRAFSAAAASLYFAADDLRQYLKGFIAVRAVDMSRASRGPRTARHRIVTTANKMAALASGARAFIAVVIVAALWVASGWLSGTSAVVAVTITSALFAIFPNPAAASRQIFWGCFAGWLTAFAYQFGVVPHLDGFALLALTIAPIIMFGSFVNSFMKWAVFGLGFNIYFCFIVGVTNSSRFDPVAMLESGFALMIGIAVAWLAFAVILPHAGEWATTNYLRQIRRQVSRLACRAPLTSDMLLRFESAMRDFSIQAAARPPDGLTGRHQLMDWAFAALEVGRAVIQVRQTARSFPQDLPPDWPNVLRRWTEAVAALFERVTPENHAEALAATQAALDALPRRPQFDSNPMIAAGFRMRALLQAVELSLRDDNLPLHP
jgi:uncharacterized membrane protein YccC